MSAVFPERLRRRPYLHVDPATWPQRRARLAEQPSEALQLCRYDARPSPSRPPRFATSILESAALVAAISDQAADRNYLRNHLDMVLASRGMDLIGVLRGHFLAALAFSYDLLADRQDETERAALRRTLTDHASRAAEAVGLWIGDDWPMESPKAVATLAGLNLAALALLGEEPGAAQWLEVSDGRLDEVLTQVATDGWWPTGFEDWNLLLPLLVRVADAWSRLADRDRFDHGLFREAWAVAIHAFAPNGTDVLDLDHVGRADLSRRQAAAASRPGSHYRWRHEPCVWALDRLAQRFAHPGFALAAVQWRARGLGRGTPWPVLWGGPPRTVHVPQPDRPCHLFDAHGLAVWRSGWDYGATGLAFTGGPTYGTTTHVWSPITDLDPDAGQFVFWHDGEVLVTDPGRAAEAQTQYHNTILVDGEGQLPTREQRPDATTLEAAWLSDLGGALVCQAAGAYPSHLGLRTFQRHLAFGAGYLLIWDQLGADRRHRFDWLLHSTGTIETGPSPTAAHLAVGAAGLHIHVLRPHLPQIRVRPVPAGSAEPFADQLCVSTNEGTHQTQFLVLLAPCRAGLPPPLTPTLVTGELGVGARLQWINGDREEVLFPSRGRGIQFDRLISDAACLALRRRPDGDWRSLLARRVAQVLIPGGEILTASQPVDVALATDESELSGEVHSPTGATLTIRCPFEPRGVLVDQASGRATMDRALRLVSIRLTAGRHHLRLTGR